MPNLAALRAAIFLLSAKNRWGGHICAPPPAVRGLTREALPPQSSRIPPQWWPFASPVKGRLSTDIGNMELWARGWRIYFSELTVSFKPQGNFFNSLYFEHPRAKSATTYYRLYYSGYRLHPNTFHNTINKNVNHSNDTIDNLNQSSFHKPARQCQGHLRTESFPALLTFTLRRKIRPLVVRSGFCA